MNEKSQFQHGTRVGITWHIIAAKHEIRTIKIKYRRANYMCRARDDDDGVGVGVPASAPKSVRTLFSCVLRRHRLTPKLYAISKLKRRENQPSTHQIIIEMNESGAKKNICTDGEVCMPHFIHGGYISRQVFFFFIFNLGFLYVYRRCPFIVIVCVCNEYWTRHKKTHSHNGISNNFRAAHEAREWSVLIYLSLSLPFPIF